MQNKLGHLIGTKQQISDAAKKTEVRILKSGFGWNAMLKRATAAVTKRRRKTNVAEICTGHDSNMSRAARNAGMSYSGLGLFNKIDLSTQIGFLKAKSHLKNKRPALTMLSPPCTYYSCMQNANQKTPRQRAQLRAKRRIHAKIFKHTHTLALHLLKDERSVVAEQPPRASSWKRTSWKLMEKLLPYHGTVKGCQVGLRSIEDGSLLSKEWCFRSDQPIVQQELAPFTRCTCPKEILPHRACAGRDTTHSEQYPMPLCEALLRASEKIAVERTPAPLDQRDASRLVVRTSTWRRKLPQCTRHGKEAWLQHHWSASNIAEHIRKQTREGGRSASVVSAAPKRKRCRKLTPYCRGGKSVSPPKSAERLRQLLLRRYGQLTVFCKWCLGCYTRRHCSMPAGEPCSDS